MSQLQLPAGMHVFERGWLSANNILFIGREETALVDSGYVTHAPQTLALVRHVLGTRTLDRLLNTHLQQSAADMQQSWDTNVYISYLTAMAFLPSSHRDLQSCSGS